VPLAFTAAIGAAAKRGIIIKAGVFLEGITKVKKIVFDKTGTITEGKPVVQSAVTFRKYPLKNFLALLGSVESESNHVLARAIVNYVLGKKIKITSLENVHEQPGFGVKAVKDGKTILVGKVKFLEENAIIFSAKENKLINDEKDKGRTITAVAIDQDLIGFVSLADGLRHNAIHVFKEIKNLGIKDLVMLTGDNEKTAAAVAAQIGVTEYKANLLPQDKIKHLQKYIGAEGKVIMIGDGVNDAAALALADIGVAMGAIGSDAAIESADIVLMKDNLENVPEVISLGKYTMRIVRQDLWIWGIVNTLGLFLVFAGVLGPSGAAAYNFITDFIPLMNSMRIFRKHKIIHQKHNGQSRPKEVLNYINESGVTEI
jgi:P-type E1-E2 ATPase